LNIHKVIAIRPLTEHTFILQLERRNLPFQTGQFITIRRPGTIDQREYTVYNGENENVLEVLVREINDGKVTPRLKKLKPGTRLEVDGPFGFFRFQPKLFPVQDFLFIATGTGISPFHSFVRTYPNLNYRLVHGVRYLNEAYDHEHFEKKRITLCTTGDKDGHFHGRVTDYLLTQAIAPETQCFLCGNSEMIQQAFDILTRKNVPVENIYTEVYF
jgi:ferredoxin/flavodoxin---NADP+ reductase